MHLYHLTALPPSTGSLLAYGSFSASRAQELVIASSSGHIALHRLTKQGTLSPVGATTTFSTLRAIAPVRPTAAKKDFLLAASDSGGIALLAFDAARRSFVVAAGGVSLFGRTGCRRVVPGHLVAADPSGRAVMVAALERGKFAFVLGRREEHVVLEGALEGHKADVATQALVGLDVGFENPVFAALERPFASPDKLLVYYQLDLGLNHVVRRFASPVGETSCLLVAVPGGNEGPGGVLVCGEGRVSFRDLVREDEVELAAGADPDPGVGRSNVELDVVLPRRTGADGGAIIACGTCHKQKTGFFFMLCSEEGDLFKVELDWSEAGGAEEMRVMYFDTIPGPAHAIAVFRSGYLFAAMEGGDAMFLKFTALAVADGDAGFSSTSFVTALTEKDAVMEKLANGDGGDVVMTSDATDTEVLGKADSVPVSGAALRAKALQATQRLHFPVRLRLQYLTLVEVLESLAPSVAIASGDFCGEGSSQLVCAGGIGQQASLRVLRRGLAIIELMAQDMARSITSVFTLRESRADPYDRFIVVSFKDSTKVLRVDDESVVESSDSGLLLDCPTIAVAQVGEKAFVQAHAGGLRFLSASSPDSVRVWSPADGTRILDAAINSAQALVALSSGDVMYFDLNEVCDTGGALEPASTLDKAIIGVATAAIDGSTPHKPALALPDVPHGRLRSSLFAVSDGQGSIVRMYQVDADGDAKSVGVHVAPAPVHSLSLIDFGALSGEALASAEMAVVSKKSVKASSSDPSVAVPVEPMLCLAVGTRKGALVLLNVDPMTGAMSGKRTKFLGLHAVRVQRLVLAGVPACVATSIRPWLMHRQGARVAISPLCTDAILSVSSFSSEQIADGFVAISGSVLRFLTLESISHLAASSALPARLPPCQVPAETVLGSTFFMSKSKLTCTPRRLLSVGPAQAVESLTAAANGRNTASQPISASGAVRAADGLFVVLESQHRSTLSTIENGATGAPGAGVKKGDCSHSHLAPADLGAWASQIRLVSIKQNADDDSVDDVDAADGNDGEGGEGGEELYASAAKTLDCIVLEGDDSCALCVACSDKLGGVDDSTRYVAVSVARHLAVVATAGVSGDSLHAKRPAVCGALYLYSVNVTTEKLDLVHITPVSEPVYAMAAFRDKLLVGLGTSLRLYELGKKQLLRKGETRLVVSNQVSALAVTSGDRVFVGDVRNSVTLFKYHSPSFSSTGPAGNVSALPNENLLSARENGLFSAVARDSLPRYVVSLLCLDYNTVCGSDKFGNVFVLRLPPELSGAEIVSGQLGAGRSSMVHRLHVEASFHVGSTVMSLTRGTLCGGTGMESSLESGLNDERECIIYNTMGGAVGVIAPFVVKSDADLAVDLEKEMRDQHKSLVGRSHVSYRSSFAPVRHIVDGDLCEMFIGLSVEAQKEIAVRLERDVADILRKLDAYRTRIL